MAGEVVLVADNAETASAGVLQARGRWQKGQSGNPRGRVAGSGNPLVRAIREKSTERVKEIAASFIEGVEKREPMCIKLWMERYHRLDQLPPIPNWPDRIESMADWEVADEAYNTAIKHGLLTTQQATSYAFYLVERRKIIASDTLEEQEQRIAALEAAYQRRQDAGA
jgi:hypothetical protein